MTKYFLVEGNYHGEPKYCQVLYDADGIFSDFTFNFDMLGATIFNSEFYNLFIEEIREEANKEGLTDIRKLPIKIEY